ncbi:MAG TPA: tetratricopeptide repeat protein [Melioribacteraceae bacterium]|mgnify:CR=1 FL=1|nr:tetratricopeptide repeat protein [Melioribacteraceae bacterium]
MNLKPLFLLMIIISAGCSSNSVKVAGTADKESKSIITSTGKIAQEKFINGSMLELKGEYESAINEYLDALKYDPQAGIHFAIAKNYYKLNKLSSAIQHSRRAVQLDSTNSEYLYLLASIYSSSRLDDSSMVVYEKIIARDSSNYPAFYQLALLNEKNRPTYALSIYNKLVGLLGPEWNLLIRIIDLNERLGNIDETISTFEELLNLNPSDLRLQKVLIESYLKTKKYDKAHKLIDESLISFPDDLNLYEMKGAAYIQTEEWKNAFDQYSRLLRSEEIGYENKLGIGTIFLNAVEKNSINLNYAKEIFVRLNRDTTDWQLNAYLGEIEIRLKNDSLAIDYFKKATELAEWNNQLWIRLGGTLFDNGKYQLVVDLLKKGVQSFPNDFAINLIYGLALSQQGNHRSAKEYLGKAVKINPNDITVLTAYGYTLNQLKEDDEALVYLNKAMIFSPNDIQVIGMTALIYESKGEYSKSDSLYSLAMSLDPGNALILNNYAYSLAERGVRIDEALEWSSNAVNIEPENPSYLDTLGWIYFRLNDFEKARSYIEKSLKYENNSGTVLDHLGDVYYKLGDKPKALEFWKKALDVEPNNNKFKEKIEKGEL